MRIVLRQQAAARGRPTVGDTVTIVKHFGLPQGTLVQPRTNLDTSLVTLVTTPEVIREGDSVRVTYLVSVWAAGRNQLRVPGPTVVRPDGTADTLPEFVVPLDVASVLPAGADVDTLRPAAARGWVVNYERTWIPVVAASLVLLLISLVAVRYWRRRGPARQVPAVPPVARVDAAMMRRWLDAGESALVVDHLIPAVSELPRTAIWLERVREVRYRPDSAAALRELAEEGLRMLGGGGSGG